VFRRFEANQVFGGISLETRTQTQENLFDDFAGQGVNGHPLRFALRYVSIENIVPDGYIRLRRSRRWSWFRHTLPMMIASITNIEEENVLPRVSSEPPAAPPDFPLKRILLFALVASAIFLAANALVCATLSHFFGIPGWIVWQLLPAAMAAAFIPATFLRFRISHPALRVAYAVTAVWEGALNFAFFAAVACWIVVAGEWLAGWSLPRFYIAAILFGFALAVTLYGLINARWIRVSRVTVRLPNLPQAWQGRTAALVTDLHLGPLFGAAFLGRVIARLRILRPDAVFVSGDMFDGSTLGLDQLVGPWRDFSTSRGIYFVTGNHDEFADRNIFLDAINRTGVQVLNNEKVTVDGLQIVGVHDSEAENPAELRSILRQVQIDRLRPSLLLAHRPVNLSVAEEEGISLQLSGHTHGGQFWPWNLLVSRIYGPFAHGLGRLGKLQVYTSNGVGTYGPPLRVGTKSEIVLMRFEKETDEN
jgi:predicted MPP superfamily phosphohydrolase